MKKNWLDFFCWYNNRTYEDYNQNEIIEDWLQARGWTYIQHPKSKWGWSHPKHGVYLWKDILPYNGRSSEHGG